MPPKEHEQRGLFRCGFTIAVAAAAAATGDTEPPAGDDAAAEPGLSWEDIKRKRDLKRSRMEIEWDLPPRPGKAKAGRPTAERIWLEALWAFFDFVVKDDQEVDPSWVPRDLPSALRGTDICVDSYGRFLRGLIDEKRAQQTTWHFSRPLSN